MDAPWIGVAQPSQRPSRARIGAPARQARRALDRDTDGAARSAPWSGEPRSRACARGQDGCLHGLASCQHGRDGCRRRRVTLPRRGKPAPRGTPSPRGRSGPYVSCRYVRKMSRQVVAEFANELVFIARYPSEYDGLGPLGRRLHRLASQAGVRAENVYGQCSSAVMILACRLFALLHNHYVR